MMTIRKAELGSHKGCQKNKEEQEDRNLAQLVVQPWQIPAPALFMCRNLETWHGLPVSHAKLAKIRVRVKFGLGKSDNFQNSDKILMSNTQLFLGRTSQTSLNLGQNWI